MTDPEPEPTAPHSETGQPAPKPPTIPMASSPHSHGDSGGDVPTFGCVVYVRSENGRTHGRVGNLLDSDRQPIEHSGASERDVLRHLVRRFKEIVSAEIESGNPAPMLDSPMEPNAGEQKRFLPVHL